MDFEQELRATRATLIGQQQAFFAVFGALIETHPNRRALEASMEQQAQVALAFLTNQTYPEAALDMFHAVMQRARVCLSTVPPQPG